MVFAKSYVIEKRYRICLNKEEISELLPESTKTFKRNTIDQYIDHPSTSYCSGKHLAIVNFCFTKFVRYYFIPSNISSKNDYQLKELKDEKRWKNHIFKNDFLKTIPLGSSKQNLKCQKIPFLLQWHVPNYFWVLGSTEMKFSQILMYLMANIPNMFLVKFSRLKTSLRSFMILMTWNFWELSGKK